MTDIDARSFSIDSTLEFTADHWEVAVPDSTLFRNSSSSDRMTLRAGLLNASNSAQMITAMVNGVIDEYELTITPNNITGAVRGRDPSALILDAFFTKLYARAPSQQPGTVAEVLPGQEAVVAPPAAQIGVFTAKTVANDAVVSVIDPVSGLPLTLQWEVRDYEIQAQTYQASGRVIDILRRLIQPWNLVEVFKVDILLQGRTIIVRHRSTPQTPLVPMYTFNLTALRRSALNVRKRRLRKLGTVTLRGQKVPDGLRRSTAAELAAGAGVFSSGTQTVSFDSTAFDEGGNIVSKVTTTETYRMPDRLLLQSVKETYTGGLGATLELSSRETVTKEWENSIYDANGPANQPKQLSDLIVREGIDHDNDEDEAFRVLADESTINEYDDLGFLETVTNTRRKFSFDDNELQNDKLSVKTYHDVGPLFVEEIAELYNWNTDREAWAIQQRDAAISGGSRPGGPGRGSSTAGTHNTPGGAGLTQITRTQTFSTDPDAQPVDFSDENMSGDDLDFIMSFFAATVGLNEYEVSFSGVGMPWLVRGQAMKFSNVQSEDGSPFMLPTILVTEVRVEYVETGGSPSYVMHARGFGHQTT